MRTLEGHPKRNQEMGTGEWLSAPEGNAGSEKYAENDFTWYPESNGEEEGKSLLVDCLKVSRGFPGGTMEKYLYLQVLFLGR